jgi:hypothetical protein
MSTVREGMEGGRAWLGGVRRGVDWTAETGVEGEKGHAGHFSYVGLIEEGGVVRLS